MQLSFLDKWLPEPCEQDFPPENQAGQAESATLDDGFEQRIAPLPPLVRAICRRDTGNAPRLDCEQCSGTIEHPTYDGQRTVCNQGPHTAWMHHQLLAMSNSSGAAYFSSPHPDFVAALGESPLDVTKDGFGCRYCHGSMMRVNGGGQGFRCSAEYNHYFWRVAGMGFWRIWGQSENIKQGPVIDRGVKKEGFVCE